MITKATEQDQSSIFPSKAVFVSGGRHWTHCGISSAPQGSGWLPTGAPLLPSPLQGAEENNQRDGGDIVSVLWAPCLVSWRMGPHLLLSLCTGPFGCAGVASLRCPGSQKSILQAPPPSPGKVSGHSMAVSVQMTCDFPMAARLMSQSWVSLGNQKQARFFTHTHTHSIRICTVELGYSFA